MKTWFQSTRFGTRFFCSFGRANLLMSPVYSPTSRERLLRSINV